MLALCPGAGEQVARQGGWDSWVLPCGQGPGCQVAWERPVQCHPRGAQSPMGPNQKGSRS